MQKQTIETFLDLVNHYPSPHNGQPIRLRQQSDDTFEVFFDRDRGLRSTDISFIFSFVSMGVFIRHAQYCAQALGLGLTAAITLPPEAALRDQGPISFGTIALQLNGAAPDDTLRQRILFRQTSRKKYTAGLQQGTHDAIIKLATEKGMVLGKLTPEQARHAIWLNQRAVFDDMFNEPVRRELDHWLRYSQKEKQTKRDGLAYDCMEMNGGLMKYVTRHPAFLRFPVIAPALQKYYLRTMSDNSDVYYLTAPFQTPEQSYAVGQVVMDTWMTITAEGAYLHPFGTVVSNEQAHREFAALAGINSESRDNYLVFIFRSGHSEVPVRSERIPYQEHLLMEEAHV